MKLLTEEIYASHIKFALVSFLYAYISQQAADIHQVDLEFILQRGRCIAIVILVVSSLLVQSCP